MRVVYDTNVLISGFLWKGTTNHLIALTERSSVHLFTSEALLTELHGILSQKKHARAVAASGFGVDDIVSRYKKMTSVVPTRKFTQQICRDADDDAVLACALAANANVIVSGDKDLLALHPFQDIPILSPANTVRLLQRDN